MTFLHLTLFCALTLPASGGEASPSIVTRLAAVQQPETPAAPKLRSRGSMPVKIALGAAYEPAEEFLGFLKESTGSSVLLHQSDRFGLSGALKSFTNARILRGQRRKLVKKSEKLNHQGYDAYLLELEQEIPGAPEARLVEVFVFGDEEACCTVQASWYAERGKGDVEELRAALRTVVWDRPVVADPFEGLTWDLQYGRGKQFRLLKHAQTTSDVVVYTDNGQVDFSNTGRPLLVSQRITEAPKLVLKPLEQFEDKPVEPAKTEEGEGDEQPEGATPIGAPAIRNGDAALSPEQRQLRDARTAYAKSRLAAVPGLEKLEVQDVRYFSVAGMPAVEMIATATEQLPGGESPEGEGAEEPTPEPSKPAFGGMFPPAEDEGPRTISLYELVVFGKGEQANEHWVVNGRIWERIGKNWMKEFQKAARSLRLLTEETAKSPEGEGTGKQKAKGAPSGVRLEKGGRKKKE
ncbi:MAG: hypothetical protein AAF368_02355 [Planctomycetota bacterium]